MTDKINALTVILNHDMRVDDAQPLIAAIKQFRGVADVQEHITDLSDHLAFVRAKEDLRRQILEVL